MSSQPKSCENTSCSYFDSNDLIRSQFCTCHDSSAVMTYAKLWPDLIHIFHIREIWIFTRFGPWAHKLFAKWFPVLWDVCVLFDIRSAFALDSGFALSCIWWMELSVDHKFDSITHSGIHEVFLEVHREPGPWFNIKISSYQYRKSHCGDKTVVRSSYIHNGVSYTGKTTSLYWIRAQDTSGHFYLHGVTLIPAWISNYIHYVVWDEITYPCVNFNGATVEV